MLNVRCAFFVVFIVVVLVPLACGGDGKGCRITDSTKVDDDALTALAVEVGRVLGERRLMFATAESCTGGWIAKLVTDVAGSSGWLDRGFVTYSNDAKTDMLGVSQATLAEHGAVSEATAREMAVGALARSDADIACAVTGIAGPGGGSADKPVGTVWFGWAGEEHVVTQRVIFDGDREAVRRQAVVTALRGVLTHCGDF